MLNDSFVCCLQAHTHKSTQGAIVFVWPGPFGENVSASFLDPFLIPSSWARWLHMGSGFAWWGEG